MLTPFSRIPRAPRPISRCRSNAAAQGARWLAWAAIAVVPVLICRAGQGNPTRMEGTPAGEARAGEVAARVSQLPLAFEPAAPGAPYQFVSRRGGAALFVTPTESVLALSARRQEVGVRVPGKRTAVRMRLIGSNPIPRTAGVEPLPGKVNYLLGNDPRQWRTDVPTYAKVKLADVYPGIDLVHHGNGRELEHDFIVRPGANPAQIRLEFAGSETLRLDPNGDLVLGLAEGEVRQRRPVVYQSIDGRRVPVAGSYVLADAGSTTAAVSFRLGAYDATKPLVIDPVLQYSTYLGGSADDAGTAIAVNSGGEAFVTGFTQSNDFPLQNHFPFASTLVDAFVTKLNAAGTAAIYSTYLGGNGQDEAYGIAVDGNGSAYIAGRTRSTDLPLGGNPAQQNHASDNGGFDAFVLKLVPNGNAIPYGTYLGGTSGDEAYAISLLPGTQTAFITGVTQSANFPTAGTPFDATLNGPDPFVSRLDTIVAQGQGSSLVYSTFLGGSSDDSGNGIAVDSLGNAYVTGQSLSLDFPVSSVLLPFQGNNAGGSGRDAFVAKLNPTGSSLLYASYLGGNGDDLGTAVAVGGVDQLYVTGLTSSTNLPTAGNPLQGGRGDNGFYDGFVAHLDTSQSGQISLVYSTYLGGTADDHSDGIAVDGDGNAYVTGKTSSLNFYVAGTPAIQASHASDGGSYDAFVTKLNPTGSALIYSTYLGGGGADGGAGIALDSDGCAYITGHTLSTNFPLAGNPPFQSLNPGGGAFVAQICEQEAIEITCPPNVTVNNDPNLCSAVVNPGVATAPGATVSGSRSDGLLLTDPYPVGVTTITWTTGNAGTPGVSCTQTVTVSDDQDPVLPALPNINGPAKMGSCSATLNLTIPTATDNCPGVTVSFVRSDGQTLLNAPYPVGVTTVTWTAMDTAGNTAVSAFTVTITEPVPPTITVPPNISVPNDKGLCTAVVNIGNPTAADNCPGVTVSCTRSDGLPLTDPYPVGLTTITCTAIDTSGNTTTATYLVRVNDVEKPVCNAPADITQSNDPGKCSAVVNIGHPTPTDNCPGVTEKCVRSDNKPLSAPYPVGVTTITCTCVDASGNSATDTQIITIKDTEPPICPAQPNFTKPADKGKCTAVVKLKKLKPKDNCVAVKETCVRSDGKKLTAPFPVGVTTITCTCTDGSGNISTSSSTVTIVDTEKPKLAVPVNIVVKRDPDSNSAVVKVPKPKAIDNCPGVTVICVRSDGLALTAPYPIGTTTITCTATDASGNVTTGSFTVKVL
jgi:hypothetical protein